MMNRKIEILLFTLAITLAFGTRFYMLGSAPHGLYLDEAGQGYSAYSILKTGKDEFGKPFPIVFRSFTDFKTPVYIYMIVPLIKIFGLTKFTVRFPSFFFSILTFPFLYLLIKNLTSKIGSRIAYQQSLAVATVLLLAISPWHILFGRTNFEVNVSLFFLISGLYYLYKSINFGNIKDKKNLKPYWLIPTAILFAIGIPSYHSQRIVIPLIMVILGIRYRSVLLTQKFRKPLVIGAIIGFLISLPTLSVMSTPGFLARATLNIFSHDLALPAGYLENYSGILKPLLNNSIFLSAQEFFGLYFSYFSPRNMFILGDSGPRSSYPELSTFFLWQFPFYIYGLYILIKKKELGEIRFLTIALLIISPIPAAVTRDPYSTIRSLIMVVPQLITISIGIVYSYNFVVGKIKAKKIMKYYNLSLIPLILVITTYSIIKLWSSVAILNEHYRAKYWNFGWEEVTETINTFDPSIPIIVDNARTEPYSQLLFFIKFDPETYQSENFEVSNEEYYTNMTRIKEKKIGNITTRAIDWEKDLLVEQYLIGDTLAISDGQIKEHNLELVRDITYPNWSIAFRIVKIVR